MCDCEPPSCYTECTPRARKGHVCCECRGIILPGEIYHVFSGIWDARASTYKTCPVCEKLRIGFQAKSECCIPFEALCEHLVESDDQAALRAFVTNALDRGADVPKWIIAAIEPVEAAPS